MPYNSRTADKFVVRFKDGVRARVYVLAKRNARSMNSQLSNWIDACTAYEETTGQNAAALLAEFADKDVVAVARKQTLPTPGMPVWYENELWILHSYSIGTEGRRVWAHLNDRNRVIVPASEIVQA